MNQNLSENNVRTGYVGLCSHSYLIGELNTDDKGLPVIVSQEFISGLVERGILDV